MADIDTIEAASEPRRALEHLIATKDLAVATRSLQGEVRYCSECSHIKVFKFLITVLKSEQEKWLMFFVFSLTAVITALCVMIVC